MSAEVFFTALNDIHDHYIEEAVHYRAPVRRVIRPILRGLAAACLALIIGFSAVMAVSVEAREIVFGWIHERIDWAHHFHYIAPPQPTDQETSGESTRKDYELPQIPEGYTLFDYIDQAGRTSYAYANFDTNQLMYFSYYQAGSDWDSYIRIENHTHHRTTVRGIDADVYLPKDPEADSAVVLWVENDMMMYVSGFFSQEELMELAESVTEVPYSPGTSGD